MLGRMQDWPLTVDKILDHAAINHGTREIISRSVAGPIVRTTYADIRVRARKVSEALLARGVKLGDRIGTLAWNSGDHMETWYGTMGIGSVLHTLNPRLYPEQLVWIINHAEDRMMFFDVTFLPLLEAIADKLPTVETFVMYGDDSMLPESTKLPNLISNEAFLSGMSGAGVTWGGFDENTACGLCYTSGTTGGPKGVLYSHRSNVLHSLISQHVDAMGVGASDVVLPIVPMFHANCWGLVFSLPIAGSTIVMPGAQLDGESVYELLDAEKVTYSAAVPTVWMMLAEYLEQSGKMLPHLKRVTIGGSAVPENIIRLFEGKYDVQVDHGWGMTETSPLGSYCAMSPETKDLPFEEKIKVKLKQGRALFGAELNVVDDAGRQLPRDGKSSGHLMIRGCAIAASYYKDVGGNILDENGWFDTSDVANIDRYGFMQITDRAKDVIKSGGEWISSIELENIAVGHEAVANAAVIGVAHPKWDERPLLIVQLKQDCSVAPEELLALIGQHVAKWQVPDDVVFVNEIPLGATGKINKLALRETFRDYKFPTA